MTTISSIYILILIIKLVSLAIKRIPNIIKQFLKNGYLVLWPYGISTFVGIFKAVFLQAALWFQENNTRNIITEK